MSCRLPLARGLITDALFDGLRGVGPVPRGITVLDDPLSDDDFQLALYCLYELHYRGFVDVDDGLEWDPGILALRSHLEEAFEARLHEDVSMPAIQRPDVRAELWRLASGDGGPSLSKWALENGTIAHARELAVHRSAYQLKEADPHTWAIPRLSGRAKAAMVALQADEYGNGSEEAMHSSLFAKTMEALGLSSSYGAYLDLLPGPTLATTNLISFFGLHRRLRGALVGHLALFEMTSVTPMARYSTWLRRLGVDQVGRRFYDVHVEADAVHQHIASDALAAGLVQTEPALAHQVLFGARALSLIESRFGNRILNAWSTDGSALLVGMPAAA